MSTIADYIRRLGQRDSMMMKGGIFFLFIFVVAMMFPRGESIESDYHVGMIWTDKDLIAPFLFPIYKEDREYQKERADASAKVYKVFEENVETSRKNIDSLQKFFDNLQSILDARAVYFHKLELAQRRHRKSEGDLAVDSTALIDKMRSLPVNITDNEWKTLQRLYGADRFAGNPRYKFSLKRLRRDVLLVVNELYLQGIVDVRKEAVGADISIALRRRTDEQIVPINKFLDVDDLGRVVQQTFISGYKVENDTVSVATKIALSFLSPNIMFQKDQTDKEIAIAMDEVPRTVGIVQENERIIGRHERITDDVKLKLDSLRKAKAERGADINRFTTFIGKFLHIFALSFLFGIYLYLFRKRIFHDNSKILLITLIVLLEALLAYLSLHMNAEVPVELLIVVPAASMLLSIIFDSRVAFYCTVTMAFIVAGIRGNDYSIALFSVVAGSLAVYTVRDIKHRTQIFRSIIFIFLGYFVSILAMSLERYDSLTSVLNQLTMAAANAVFSPVLTYGLLIFFERFFHITTDLTLLELSDFNQPLLKELSQKAPGTFNHSVNMGTLAESAAEAIGANATLARVGAYYHDIGKITKPAMFVENQLGAVNRHERLNPNFSAKVIAAHVKDGITLGKEFGLPDIVTDFIPMHHGTTRIGFFYDEALKKRGHYETVDEDDFRYPGPKPQTKETGIVMLADAVEASTRSIENPTVQKIEQRIDELIKARFMEGQLDECELTLRDLTRIKASFLKILTGIHHSRMQYPEQQSAPPTAAQSELLLPEKEIVAPAERARRKRPSRKRPPSARP
ncbi:MAG TPA: HDIG domain-containing protein [Bacteroidota bacterium]|nr:HDIG domain-containing protein [Bacteroidota bacterium]